LIATVKFPYNPLPKQDLFHKSKAKYRLYASGFGSGKTFCGATEAIHQSLWYKDNLGLVGRMTYPELRDTTRKEILEYPLIVDGKETQLINSPLIKKFNQSENVLTFYNGSQIFFRALGDAFHKIKSLNLGWFYIDELSEANDEIWLGLCGRLRRAGYPHKGFGTSNPEGRNWMWKRFIADRSPDYFIVQASSEENVHLPKGYIKGLIDQYPDDWVKRYVHGSFDTFEGLIYKEFDARVGGPHVIASPEIPDDHYRFIALDHGFRNPTAVLWGAVDRNGHLTIYDEFYQSGLLVSEIAGIIKTKTGDNLIRTYLIDPSCRNRDGKSGHSVIDEFEENGIYFEPANNEVKAGINHLQEYFHVVGGKSKISISNSCKNLIRELQVYQYKHLKIGNVSQPTPEKPVKRDDHAVDALRYLCTYIYDTPNLVDKKRDYRDWAYATDDADDNWMAA
jgi:PBSX family phage terminase large subunit